MALNTLVAAGILVPAVYVTNDYFRRRAADDLLIAAVETAMANDGRAHCEAQPATFGGGDLEPLPPISIFRPFLEVRPQIFAYDAAFRSDNPAAPAFSDDLRAALIAGASRAAASYPFSTAVGRQLAVQMPWGAGPCAIILSRFGPFALPASTEMFRALLVTMTFIAAALLAAAPIIARISRLTIAVKASADSEYAAGIPVTGHDEIGELETAFNRAGAQVKTQMASIKSREATLRSVVANTTHDVAIPLTVVQGHLSTLQSLVPLEGPIQDGLRGAIRETHYLAALLHNLGVAARLENPTPVLECQPLDLNKVVERVVARHQPLARTLTVELDAAVPEQPSLVSADVTLVEQAASNLVHNAIHYNNAGGHVAVILATIDDGRRFSLRVIDDGPGIPASERARLTDRAFRGEAGRARRPEGQGLGLHIVREVVDRHAFELRIGASEFGGTEIDIRGSRLG